MRLVAEAEADTSVFADPEVDSDSDASACTRVAEIDDGDMGLKILLSRMCSGGDDCVPARIPDPPNACAK